MSQSKLVDGGGCCLVGLMEFCCFLDGNPQRYPFCNVAVEGTPVGNLPNGLPLLKPSLLNLSLEVDN